MNDTIVMLIILAGVLSITITSGLLLSWKTNHPAFIAITVALTSIFTFFGILMLPINSGAIIEITDSSLRNAIATSLVIEYILLISITAFTKGSINKELNPISQTLINNFTVVIGLVLAFYFGSSAYVEVNKNIIKSPSQVVGQAK